MNNNNNNSNNKLCILLLGFRMLLVYQLRWRTLYDFLLLLESFAPVTAPGTSGEEWILAFSLIVINCNCIKVIRQLSHLLDFLYCFFVVRVTSIHHEERNQGTNTYNFLIWQYFFCHFLSYYFQSLFSIFTHSKTLWNIVITFINLLYYIGHIS
jgi:hypothetical protein